MAPRPIPAALRLITATRDGKGNLTPERFKDKLNPKPGAPKSPAELMPDALEEWNRIAGGLANLGVLTPYDRSVLTLYCQEWGRWLEAQRMIAELGLVMANRKGIIAISNNAGRNCAKYAAELGLTPSARTKIDTTGLNARAAGQTRKKEIEEFFG